MMLIPKVDLFFLVFFTLSDLKSTLLRFLAQIISYLREFVRYESREVNKHPDRPLEQVSHALCDTKIKNIFFHLHLNTINYVLKFCLFKQNYKFYFQSGSFTEQWRYLYTPNCKGESPSMKHLRGGHRLCRFSHLQLCALNNTQNVKLSLLCN